MSDVHQIFVCKLSVAMARFCCSGVAIHYALPVLWMDDTIFAHNGPCRQVDTVTVSDVAALAAIGADFHRAMVASSRRNTPIIGRRRVRNWTRSMI